MVSRSPRSTVGSSDSSQFIDHPEGSAAGPIIFPRTSAKSSIKNRLETLKREMRSTHTRTLLTTSHPSAASFHQPRQPPKQTPRKSPWNPENGYTKGPSRWDVREGLLRLHGGEQIFARQPQRGAIRGRPGSGVRHAQASTRPGNHGSRVG